MMTAHCDRPQAPQRFAPRSIWYRRLGGGPVDPSAQVRSSRWHEEVADCCSS